MLCLAHRVDELGAVHAAATRDVELACAFAELGNGHLVVVGLETLGRVVRGGRRAAQGVRSVAHHLRARGRGPLPWDGGLVGN